MLPTNRLFSIIQILRNARLPVKAQKLADKFEVSIRTIYRDIAELQNQHVPIQGEAGVGYILKPGYELPPLMLTANELEAVALGAHWVSQRGDKHLSQSANSLLEKIKNVVPEHLQSVILDSNLISANFADVVEDSINMDDVREAIRQQNKLFIAYTDVKDNTSHRIIWPIMVAYFNSVRLVVAWCENRHDFRHFRTDRIKKIELLNENYPQRRQDLKAQWQIKENIKLAKHRDNND